MCIRDSLRRVISEPGLTSLQRRLFEPIIEPCFGRQSDMVSIAPSIHFETKLGLPFLLGSRAMKYDPLCGDGTGQGIKSAILAIGACNSETKLGNDTVRMHMRNRMSGTFCAHLRNCISYYQTIESSIAWQSDIEKMQHGLASLYSNVKHEDVPSLSLKVPVKIKDWAEGPSLIEA